MSGEGVRTQGSLLQAGASDHADSHGFSCTEQSSLQGFWFFRLRGCLVRESEQEERVCVKWHSTAALACGRSCGPPSYRVCSELRATRSGCVRGSWSPAALPSLSPRGTPFSSSAKALAPLHMRFGQPRAPRRAGCRLFGGHLWPLGLPCVDWRLCRTNTILPRLTQQPQSNTRRWIQVSDFPGRGIPTRAGS